MNTEAYTAKRKFLTLSEVEKLLLAARTNRQPERDYCLVYMAFIHGLRVTELRSIRLSDLDLDSGSLYIRRLKSGLSTIHPFARDEKEVLRAWMAVRAKEPAAGSDWLFPSHQAGPFSRQRIHVIISELGRKAGLSVNVHPHMLRHACGFALADRGLDTRLIQDYLGHRNIRHTVGYTASNPARFFAAWGDVSRNFDLHLGPKCTLWIFCVNYKFLQGNKKTTYCLQLNYFRGINNAF